MIKFFRRIRQNLLARGKTATYFKYAIGEIVLVVIGILIAVQINSWNTSYQKEKLKTTYTQNLISDLVKDTLQLNDRVKWNKDGFLKLNDSLRVIFAKPTTTVNDIKQIGKKIGIKGLRTLNTYNDNTFKNLISSGNIDLFEQDLIQKIMNLNRSQNVEIEVSNGNRESYFRIYNNYLLRYIGRSGDINKTIKTELWKNVDATEFASIYINATNVNHHAVLRYIELTEDVLLNTKELIEILKSSLDVK